MQLNGERFLVIGAWRADEHSSGRKVRPQELETRGFDDFFQVLQIDSSILLERDLGDARIEVKGKFLNASLAF